MKNKIDLINFMMILHAVYGDYDSKLGIVNVEIKRRFLSRRIKSFVIETCRPGLLIGRKGEDIDRLRAELEKEFGYSVQIELKEIEQLPFLSLVKSY